LTTYQIRVNGQEFTVEIDDPNATPVRVTVDGTPFEVTVSQQGIQATAKPVQSDSAQAASTDLLLDAYVPAVASTYVEVTPEAEPLDTAKPPTQTPGEGTEAVTAPMPGTILDIAVRAGDAVQAGDILCNLEAMKMKSPIRSSSSGTVAQVLIGEGQNVGFGDVLFTIR
jgi:biotin carboxyl carrier protein